MSTAATEPSVSEPQTMTSAVLIPAALLGGEAGLTTFERLKERLLEHYNIEVRWHLSGQRHEDLHASCQLLLIATDMTSHGLSEGVMDQSRKRGIRHVLITRKWSIVQERLDHAGYPRRGKGGTPPAPTSPARPEAQRKAEAAVNYQFIAVPVINDGSSDKKTALIRLALHSWPDLAQPTVREAREHALHHVFPAIKRLGSFRTYEEEGITYLEHASKKGDGGPRRYKAEWQAIGSWEVGSDPGNVVAPANWSAPPVPMVVDTQKGSFRLEAIDRDATQLVVQDPTDKEWELLNRFIVLAREKGWIDAAEGILRMGRSELRLAVHLGEAGALFTSDAVMSGAAESSRGSEGTPVTSSGTDAGLEPADPVVEYIVLTGLKRKNSTSAVHLVRAAEADLWGVTPVDARELALTWFEGVKLFNIFKREVSGDRTAVFRGVSKNKRTGQYDAFKWNRIGGWDKGDRVVDVKLPKSWIEAAKKPGNNSGDAETPDAHAFLDAVFPAPMDTTPMQSSDSLDGKAELDKDDEPSADQLVLYGQLAADVTALQLEILTSLQGKVGEQYAHLVVPPSLYDVLVMAVAAMRKEAL